MFERLFGGKGAAERTEIKKMLNDSTAHNAEINALISKSYKSLKGDHVVELFVTAVENERFGAAKKLAVLRFDTLTEEQQAKIKDACENSPRVKEKLLSDTRYSKSDLADDVFDIMFYMAIFDAFDVEGAAAASADAVVPDATEDTSNEIFDESSDKGSLGEKFDRESTPPSQSPDITPDGPGLDDVGGDLDGGGFLDGFDIGDLLGGL